MEVRGQDFVDTVTNQRLMIIGVDYQPGGQAGYKPQDGEDALTDGDVCLRDAAVMQKLGVGAFCKGYCTSFAVLMCCRSTPSASTMSTLLLTIQLVLRFSTRRVST